MRLIDSGSINIGYTVKLRYVDQSRTHLNNNYTVWEKISKGLEILDIGSKIKIKSRVYCSTFNFKGEQKQKKISDLSEGKKIMYILQNH